MKLIGLVEEGKRCVSIDADVERMDVPTLQLNGEQSLVAVFLSAVRKWNQAKPVTRLRFLLEDISE